MRSDCIESQYQHVILYALRLRIRSLLRRRVVDRGRAELQFYIDHEVESAHRRRPGRRGSRRCSLGGVMRVKKECRDARGLAVPSGLLREIGFASRVLRRARGSRRPSSSRSRLVSAYDRRLSVMHAVLLGRPMRTPGAWCTCGSSSTGRCFELQKLDGLDGAIATDFYNMILTGGDLPEAVNVARMSPNAFEFLGVPPLLGRAFTSAGSPAGEEPEHVVVISYGFWQRHFGGEANVLGQTMQLDHESYQVIGVVPPRFLWRVADAYIPLRVLSYNEPGLELDARLKPGVERERVEGEALG